MNLQRREGVRRVEIHGHQIYWEGYFHGWTRVDGELHAVIEDDHGGIHLADFLPGLKFYDSDILPSGCRQ